jgi:hypothetical protein
MTGAGKRCRLSRLPDGLSAQDTPAPVCRGPVSWVAWRTATVRWSGRHLPSPAGLIAYRLEHLKPMEATPLRTPQAQRPNVTPMQNCDACDRGHRAEHPGLCQDCATASAAA